jgi:hypothetical protein
MEHIIISAGSLSNLDHQIKQSISEGFKLVGGHQSVVIFSQNKYSGTQHMCTVNTVEYSQTMVKE